VPLDGGEPARSIGTDLRQRDHRALSATVPSLSPTRKMTPDRAASGSIQPPVAASALQQTRHTLGYRLDALGGVVEMPGVGVLRQPQFALSRLSETTGLDDEEVSACESLACSRSRAPSTSVQRSDPRSSFRPGAALPRRRAWLGPALVIVPADGRDSPRGPIRFRRESRVSSNSC
jgi:hypothetical protein